MRDEDRPAVLAHQRFDEHRQTFAGLDLASRFTRIERMNLWGAPTSVSGLGSEFDSTSAVRSGLAELVRRRAIRSILDAPCGDAGWIAHADLDVDYAGLDIVPSVIARAKANGAGDAARRRFLVADITHDALPRADLVLCRDCLVHLSFANIAKAVARFRESGSVWLLTTTFPGWNENRDCEDGDWRALNFQKPPFSWPAPAELIDERCEEAGGGWSDKSLGLWRLADLPRA